MILGVALLALVAQHDVPRREFQASCAGCHVVPDPSLRSDRVWLGFIPSTA